MVKEFRLKEPTKVKEGFMAGNNHKNKKRGLGSASEQTRERVARAGGQARQASRGQNSGDNNMSDTLNL